MEVLDRLDEVGLTHDHVEIGRLVPPQRDRSAARSSFADRTAIDEPGSAQTTAAAPWFLPMHRARAVLRVAHMQHRPPSPSARVSQADPFLAALALGYGGVAALSPLAQLHRVARRKSSADVSLTWLALYGGGCVVWLLYGASAGGKERLGHGGAARGSPANGRHRAAGRAPRASTEAGSGRNDG